VFAARPVFTVDVFDTRGRVEKSIARQCIFPTRPVNMGRVQTLATRVHGLEPVNTSSVYRALLPLSSFVTAPRVTRDVLQVAAQQVHLRRSC